MDEQYASPFERGITELLTLSPSGYWARNCYVGASFMSRAECDIRGQIGVSRIMWGADYPHIEGTWPHSQDALRIFLRLKRRHDAPAGGVDFVVDRHLARYQPAHQPQRNPRQGIQIQMCIQFTQAPLQRIGEIPGTNHG